MVTFSRYQSYIIIQDFHGEEVTSVWTLVFYVLSDFNTLSFVDGLPNFSRMLLDIITEIRNPHYSIE